MLITFFTVTSNPIAVTRTIVAMLTSMTIASAAISTSIVFFVAVSIATVANFLPLVAMLTTSVVNVTISVVGGSCQCVVVMVTVYSGISTVFVRPSL